MSRFARQSQGFRVKGQIPDCDFVSRPGSKENLRLRNDSSNEPLTRSNVNQQRVSHSFRRASRSFQIHHPRVSHSCRRASRSFQIRNSRSRSTEDRQPQCSASTTARIRGKGLNGAPLPCLPCFCCVSCAQTWMRGGDQKKKKEEQKKKEKGEQKKKGSKKCLPCFCYVSCAQLSFTLEPDDGLCAHG